MYKLVEGTMLRLARSGFTLIELLVFLCLFVPLIVGIILIACGSVFAGAITVAAPFALGFGIWLLCGVLDFVSAARETSKAAAADVIVRDNDLGVCKYLGIAVVAWQPHGDSIRLLVRPEQGPFERMYHQPARGTLLPTERLLQDSAPEIEACLPAEFVDELLELGQDPENRRLMLEAGLLDPQLRLSTGSLLPDTLKRPALQQLVERAWTLNLGSRLVILQLAMNAYDPSFSRA